MDTRWSAAGIRSFLPMKTLDPQAIWILAGVRPSRIGGTKPSDSPSRRKFRFRDHQSHLSTGAGQFTKPDKT